MSFIEQNPEIGIMITGHVGLTVAHVMHEILQANMAPETHLAPFMLNVDELKNDSMTALVKVDKDIAQLAATIPTPRIKKRKPNKGITIGSYKKHKK